MGQKCIPIPTVPLPTVAGGFSYLPPIPALPQISTPGICCKMPPLPVPKIPVKIPPLVMIPLVAILKQAVTAVNTAIDSINLTCPRE